MPDAYFTATFKDHVKVTQKYAKAIKVQNAVEKQKRNVEPDIFT